ncbi:MAG: radical SAM protein [Spirochaetota bacterium]
MNSKPVIGYPEYEQCRLCPNFCAVNRNRGEVGICGEGAALRIAFAGIHGGEEPCISVESAPYQGSGTIFFSGCGLGCSFCQNNQLSGLQRDHMGRVVTEEEFARIALALQKHGAANINLVTGTQFLPSIAAGIQAAHRNGLAIPVVWNTSSFESPEGLDLLDSFADIYLADVKSLDSQFGSSVLGRSDYGRYAREAVDAMVSSRDLRWENSRLIRGVIIRHLVLPNLLEATNEVLQVASRRWKDRSLISLMVQYLPNKPETEPFSLSIYEYEQLLGLLEELNINEGFIQEPGDESAWRPDFSRNNPFPQEYSIPVWHWKNGFVLS